MQAYSNPKREMDPHTLPDLEVFEANTADCPRCGTGECVTDDAAPCRECGFEGAPWNNSRTAWFWWFCFPGCMPEGEPKGPFETAAEALANAREGMDDYDEGEPDDAEA